MYGKLLQYCCILLPLGLSGSFTHLPRLKMNPAPLILCLRLNKEASTLFTELRQQYFPPERNYLQAHLTLFHKLPPSESSQIVARLSHIALQHSPISLTVTGPKSIGNGVAYFVESEALQQLHKSLQQDWHQWLVPQDKQKLRPHITIQNKVGAAQAKALLEKLESSFSPFTITGTGFTLWEYMGGPWRLYKTIYFQ